MFMRYLYMPYVCVQLKCVDVFICTHLCICMYMCAYIPACVPVFCFFTTNFLIVIVFSNVQRSGYACFVYTYTCT